MKVNFFKIHYLIRLCIFWLLYFALYRLVFIIYHHARIPDGYHSDTVLAFLYALRLDLSTTCVALFIPYVLWVIQQHYKSRLWHQINKYYNTSIIILVSLLSMANIKMYGEWGTLLNARALKFLMYPKEILHSISIWAVMLLLSACALFAYIAIRAYKNFTANFSYPIENKWMRLIQAVFILPILIIFYRGGFQLAPINESSAYYSTVDINNQIATNNVWYLIHSIVEANDDKNIYQSLDAEKARKKKEDLYAVNDSSFQKILKTDKPNIIFIILESWTADVIEALGGEKNITPHFNQLQKEGILFTNMYGSGTRTDQGLVAVLSGFPAQPNNSIITTPSKSQGLPSFTKIMEAEGYHSSFYYGGEIEFANMKSYLLSTGFENIVDIESFKSAEMSSKWGARDEHVLSKQLADLKNAEQPFFSTLLTLSTHEPFDVNIQSPFNGTDDASLFKKAAYYTDLCLYNYFEEAKKQTWYNNTLFVLVADHGHHLPLNRSMDEPESRKIASMIIGGAILDSLRGTELSIICNQNDLPASILAQLNLKSNEFEWSKNVFNSSAKQFAYYSQENVLGWITPNEPLVYSLKNNKLISPEIVDSTIQTSVELNNAKAYLQTLYQQYLNY
jgi:phosphoglycerol transferase MdoB-like AlkP superfamily enzyme